MIPDLELEMRVPGTSDWTRIVIKPLCGVWHIPPGEYRLEGARAVAGGCLRGAPGFASKFVSWRDAAGGGEG